MLVLSNLVVADARSLTALKTRGCENCLNIHDDLSAEPRRSPAQSTYS